MLTCIIIDDEPLARKGLKEYIGDVEFLELVGEFPNPLRAMERILAGGVDLIFLDIQMPRMTGLDFLKTLDHPPKIIFTTAYPEYAVEGFEWNAVDYLVKPFAFDRFMKAVIKARPAAEILTAPPAGEEEADYFFIKCDNRLVRIRYDSVLYVEGLQNYVAIHCSDRKYVTYLTLKQVQGYLREERFIKTHKSYIVAMAKIDAIEGNEIRIGQHVIPISRSEKEAVIERITRNRLLKRD